MNKNRQTKDTINIILTSSEYYVPYTYVLMYSIIKNTSANISFYILSNDITEKSKNILNALNVKINYVLVNTDAYPIPKQKRASSIVYSKMFLPQICPELDKAIVLDSDMIVDCDIEEIYNTDIKDYYVAWVQDAIDVKGESAEFVKRIGLQYPYINSGFLLLNLQNYKKDNIMGKIWDAYTEYKDKIEFFDQDLLYILLSEKCKYVDTIYNYLPTLKYQISGINDYCDLNYKILHYGTDRKPWLFPETKLAHVWWQYARKTPFYEEILVRLIDFRAQKQSFNKFFYISRHPLYFGLKKFRYCLLQYLTGGKKREKYKAKYKSLKSEMKEAHKFFKELKKSI